LRPLKYEGLALFVYDFRQTQIELGCLFNYVRIDLFYHSDSGFHGIETRIKFVYFGFGVSHVLLKLVDAFSDFYICDCCFDHIIHSNIYFDMSDPENVGYLVAASVLAGINGLCVLLLLLYLGCGSLCPFTAIEDKDDSPAVSPMMEATMKPLQPKTTAQKRRKNSVSFTLRQQDDGL